MLSKERIEAILDNVMRRERDARAGSAAVIQIMVPEPLGSAVVRLVLHCTCGETRVSHTALGGLEDEVDWWVQYHTGPGHEFCDAATAREARREKGRRAVER